MDHHVIIKIVEHLRAGRYGACFPKYSYSLSFEYLLLTALFTASIQLIYRINCLKRFLTSLFLLETTGSFYMIDTFYPYATLTTLQSFVPLMASSATLVLDWMGYATLLVSGPDETVHMLIRRPTGRGHWHLYRARLFM